MKMHLKKIMIWGLTLLLTGTPLIAQAQACYSTFNGQNTYIDGEYSFRLNTTVDLYALRSFFGNNRITGTGITAFWRYSTDATTQQRAITSLPGYTSFVATGTLTTAGKGTLKFTAREKKSFLIYYKFLTERGDVVTATYKVTIT